MEAGEASEEGRLFTDFEIWIMRSARDMRAPTLAVFYTFDENRVYLKSARLARPNEY